MILRIWPWRKLLFIGGPLPQARGLEDFGSHPAESFAGGFERRGYAPWPCTARGFTRPDAFCGRKQTCHLRCKFRRECGEGFGRPVGGLLARIYAIKNEHSDKLVRTVERRAAACEFFGEIGRHEPARFR